MFNAPLFATPGIGASSIQVDAVKSDFPLLMQLAWGGNGIVECMNYFFIRYGYSSITVFRDDSFQLFSSISDLFLRTMMGLNEVIYRGTNVRSFRSKRPDERQYATFLQAANEKSRSTSTL